eukprot:UN03443
MALKYLEEMKSDSIEPNVMSFTNCIGSCKDVDSCYYFYNLMKQCKIKPDIILFTAFLKVSMDSDFNESMKIFELIKSENLTPNVITINLMLQNSKKFDKRTN